MAGIRRTLLSATIAVSLLLPVALVAVYLANPLDARTVDPRLRLFGHAPYRVAATSMEPAYPMGAIVLVRVVGAAQVPQLSRGDVVVFRVPEEGGRHWMMRIAGLPGETVALRDGALLVDGRAHEEPHVLAANALLPRSRDMAPVDVPDGHFFLLGDDRDNSVDSRLLAPTRAEDVIGRIVAQSR